MGPKRIVFCEFWRLEITSLNIWSNAEQTVIQSIAHLKIYGENLSLILGKIEKNIFDIPNIAPIFMPFRTSLLISCT